MKKAINIILYFISIALISVSLTSCSNDEPGIDGTGKHNGHEWIDLGLSVKWATCNVGADSPEEYGNYFAWGETKSKTEYTKDNSITYGSVIGDFSGDPTYDVARANWKGKWRMPTVDELEELLDNTSWTLATHNGVNGCKLTSKINNNSIFFPCSGVFDEDGFQEENILGIYWTSTPIKYIEGKDYQKNSVFYFMVRYEGEYSNIYRYIGASVRPVCY